MLMICRSKLNSVLAFLVVAMVMGGVCMGGQVARQRLTPEQFRKCLQGLKAAHFKEKVSGIDEIYRLKLHAATLDPNDSWPAILQLWVAKDFDYVRLLWWQKDDTETRAFIVSLEWCMVAVPEKGQAWPGGIDDFETMAMRFADEERELRLKEAAFVRENSVMIGRELGVVLAANNIKLGRQYEGCADARTVDAIDLIEGLVPKSGEPETDPHAAAIVALGRRGAPFLVQKIVDDRESKVFYAFQYKIGDIAHDLLCDIYRQDPSGELMARKPPIDAGHGYYFADYMALVDSREGREELQAAWKKIIEETEPNEQRGKGK